MDDKLEALKKKIKGSWFPSTIDLFERDDAPDISALIDILIAEALDVFKVDCPVLKARVYTDFLSDPLYPPPRALRIAEVDPGILRVLGIYNAGLVPPDMVGLIDRVSGRDVTNIGVSGASPYLSEQTAIDLYRRLDVDQWSGRMDRPLVLSDDGGEYLMPSAGNFTVFYLAQRPVSVEQIPGVSYKLVESFLTQSLADNVINAVGRYPLALQMDRMTNHRNDLDPTRLKSLTISGKLKLSMEPTEETAESQMSEMFDSGSAAKYLENLQTIRDDAKKIYDVLKYVDLGGISLG